MGISMSESEQVRRLEMIKVTQLRGREHKSTSLIIPSQPKSENQQPAPASHNTRNTEVLKISKTIPQSRPSDEFMYNPTKQKSTIEHDLEELPQKQNIRNTRTIQSSKANLYEEQELVKWQAKDGRQPREGREGQGSRVDSSSLRGRKVKKQK